MASPTTPPAAPQLSLGLQADVAKGRALDLSQPRAGASYFCLHNPAINSFALSGPEEMCATILFAVASQLKDWGTIYTLYPYLIQYLKDGHRVDRYDPKDVKDMGALLFPHNKSIQKMWDMRHEIFTEVKKCYGDDLALFKYLRSLPGLAVIKAGFAIQLIAGKFGCIDSVNSYFYGGVAPDSKGNNDKKQAEYIAFLQQLEKTLNDPISKRLWDDWCDIVAHRIRNSGDGKRKELEVTLHNGKANIRSYPQTRITQAYYRDGANKTGEDVSFEHGEAITGAFNDSSEFKVSRLEEAVQHRADRFAALLTEAAATAGGGTPGKTLNLSLRQLVGSHREVARAITGLVGGQPAGSETPQVSYAPELRRWVVLSGYERIMDLGTQGVTRLNCVLSAETPRSLDVKAGHVMSMAEAAECYAATPRRAAEEPAEQPLNENRDSPDLPQLSPEELHDLVANNDSARRDPWVKGLQWNRQFTNQDDLNKLQIQRPGGSNIINRSNRDSATNGGAPGGLAIRVRNQLVALIPRLKSWTCNTETYPQYQRTDLSFLPPANHTNGLTRLWVIMQELPQNGEVLYNLLFTAHFEKEPDSKKMVGERFDVERQDIEAADFATEAAFVGGKMDEFAATYTQRYGRDPWSNRKPLHEGLSGLIGHSLQLLREMNLGLPQAGEESIEANQELSIPGLMPDDTLCEGLNPGASFEEFAASTVVVSGLGGRTTLYFVKPDGTRVPLAQRRDQPADENAWKAEVYAKFQPKPLTEADTTSVPVISPQREEQAPQPPATELI